MNKELSAIFNYLEKEKGISKDLSLQVLKEALLSVLKKHFGNDENISVEIDKKTCDIDVSVEKEIVSDSNEEESGKISLELARELDEDCEVGQFIDIPIAMETLGRIGANNMRYVINKKLKEIERSIVYDKYRNCINTIVSGTVKKTWKNKKVIVDLGKAEGILLAKNYPQEEFFREGDNVKAILLEMNNLIEGGVEVVLSRSEVKFVELLLKNEIPEINDNIIVINKIAREPGICTKVAVSSKEQGLDVIGCCVGIRGCRIKNVIREINKERIDVVSYDFQQDVFLKNIFHSINFASLSLEMDDYNNEYFLVVVNDEDFPIAMGKRGSNVRLASQLIEKKIVISKKSEYVKQIEDKLKYLQSSDKKWLDDKISASDLKKINVSSWLLETVLQDIIDAGYVSWRMILLSTKDQIVNDAKCDRENVQNILEELAKKSSQLEKIYEKSLS